ncbi:gluconokinase [Zafaria sp. Z1313]|uniref:gluconokinase n=1 Tax=unclassified Zafaria TaxID=2828765 RepID=UPI002E75AE42|nr:gluconokinase [Zafaria sp. J156]MEE1621448.1 gluconokinase [Zafaria sp. J156]
MAEPPPPPATHLVVMGVSGSGKTTLASHLARRLGWPAAEADDFHSRDNIAKMAAGTPLTDDDRWPWLRSIRDWMAGQGTGHAGSIVTCSALKRSYRDLLREAPGRVLFLHVTGDPALITDRMEHRAGHFMPPGLLPSQLETLEALEGDESGVVLVNDSSEEDLLRRALASLDLHPTPSPTTTETP